MVVSRWGRAKRSILQRSLPRPSTLACGSEDHDLGQHGTDFGTDAADHSKPENNLEAGSTRSRDVSRMCRSTSFRHNPYWMMVRW